MTTKNWFMVNCIEGAHIIDLNDYTRFKIVKDEEKFKIKAINARLEVSELGVFDDKNKVNLCFIEIYRQLWDENYNEDAFADNEDLTSTSYANPTHCWHEMFKEAQEIDKQKEKEIVKRIVESLKKISENLKNE